MSFFVAKGKPEAIDEKVELKEGAFIVIGLFILTITMAVSAHNFLHLPPVVGMMTGLGVLKVFGYYLKIKDMRARKLRNEEIKYRPGASALHSEMRRASDVDKYKEAEFNIFNILALAEWDTLMFFLWCDFMCRRPWHHGLSCCVVRLYVYRFRSDNSKCPGGYRFSNY